MTLAPACAEAALAVVLTAAPPAAVPLGTLVLACAAHPSAGSFERYAATRASISLFLAVCKRPCLNVNHAERVVAERFSTAANLIWASWYVSV